jgi:thiol-disulfide isomerase/thioredoxin
LLAQLLTFAWSAPSVDYHALAPEIIVAATIVVLIVLDAFTSWCKPCKMVDQVVFADPKVKVALKNVRLAKYDTERGDGVEVAQRFGISTWPTVLVLTPDGTLVGKIGSQEPASFIAELAPLERLAAAPGPFTAEALARPDADPRSLLIGGLLASRKSPPDQSSAQALFERAAASDADGKAGVRLRATSLAAEGRYVAALTALLTAELDVRAKAARADGDALIAKGQKFSEQSKIAAAKAEPQAETRRLQAEAAFLAGDSGRRGGRHEPTR